MREWQKKTGVLPDLGYMQQAEHFPHQGPCYINVGGGGEGHYVDDRGRLSISGHSNFEHTNLPVHSLVHSHSQVCLPFLNKLSPFLCNQASGTDGMFGPWAGWKLGGVCSCIPKTDFMVRKTWVPTEERSH